MIHVNPVAEPTDFDKRVRIPGKKLLDSNPAPKDKEWRKYWTRVLPELHEAYRCICAYSCHWIPHVTGSRTVEHFKPKDIYPDQAYEWENYRLVCATMNGRKGTRGILDPFEIEDGWFVLKFPSLLIFPSEDLDTTRAAQVQSTIECLKLNDEGSCIKSRADYVLGYCRDEFPFPHLSKQAPFIASELQRQGLVDSIKNIMLT